MADADDRPPAHPTERRPARARQHVTAGPYSPVLEISAGSLVVISGQVGVDLDGNILGDTIEEQTHATLENCRTQFAAADADLADVFKLNVYLTDLADWPRCNTVYESVMPAPLRVRTAIQCVLLPGFRVEIGMWAAKPKAQGAA